ncbi:hypothetical protein IJ22_18620 [Paenibacillus naphthalenovorans]|uniref:Uncharacterized protein n=1 Tax=Paenibacillus naphthalenovorans TaxID=162209 RepID=A0A0U2UGC3_9BACL|nr:hypothetical protein IJ22_18620 [Paenibacillus naphthalenovorans]
MSTIEFAENRLNVRLTYHQKELLTLLQTNPDGWYNSLCIETLEMKQVREVFSKWRESVLIGA